MIGDGKSPNLFFVTENGVTVTITRNYAAAYFEWRNLAWNYPRIECALEDRKFGVIASQEPESDTINKLIIRDDSGTFLRHHKVI